MPAATPETSFAWKVPNMERNLADGMVTTVHYTITAHDGTYSSSAYGSIGLEPADPGSMVPFDQLDEATVINWVINSFGPEKIQEIEAALDAQIAEKIAPTKASGVPW